MYFFCQSKYSCLWWHIQNWQKKRQLIFEWPLTYCPLPFQTITEMKKVWGNADDWPRRCNVSQDPQQGGTFNGNAWRRLLSKTDILRAISPLHCIPFVEAFTSKAFNDVSSSFSNALSEDFEEKIELFKTLYLDLAINETPKVPCVLFHITEFCKDKKRGLGMYSEQASESVHANFSVTWKRFKVSETHKDYGSKLLRAVLVYNCEHLKWGI